MTDFPYARRLGRGLDGRIACHDQPQYIAGRRRADFGAQRVGGHMLAHLRVHVDSSQTRLTGHGGTT
ncbi:hypothetical protein M065_1102 [Bacteroides fragilis str. Korea 419]|nr:hypothetical protein M065_1102 [Bacteroides fragilis str. Korea 419]